MGEPENFNVPAPFRLKTSQVLNLPQVAEKHKYQFPGKENESVSNPKAFGHIQFPPTRTILWNRQCIGKQLALSFASFAKLSVNERALHLAYRHAQIHGTGLQAFLVGQVTAKDDGTLLMHVDRFDPGMEGNIKTENGVMATTIPTTTVPGDVVLPLSISHGMAFKDHANTLTHDRGDFVKTFQMLASWMSFKRPVEVERLAAGKIMCSFHPDDSDHLRVSLTCSLVVPGCKISLVPVNPVPIILTALARNLLGGASLSDVQHRVKTGFVTMDQTRKLLLLLESDPNAYTLPLVGIWVTGLASEVDPTLWICCLKFFFNSNIAERVHAPPESYLLVYFSSAKTGPVFYEFFVQGGCPSVPDMRLLTCCKDIKISKAALYEQSGEVSFDLCEPNSGELYDVFTDARAVFAGKPLPSKYRIPTSKKSDDEEHPHTKPSPSPQAPVVSRVVGLVPELSMCETTGDAVEERKAADSAGRSHIDVVRGAADVDRSGDSRGQLRSGDAIKNPRQTKASLARMKAARDEKNSKSSATAGKVTERLPQVPPQSNSPEVEYSSKKGSLNLAIKFSQRAGSSESKSSRRSSSKLLSEGNRRNDAVTVHVADQANNPERIAVPSPMLRVQDNIRISGENHFNDLPRTAQPHNKVPTSPSFVADVSDGKGGGFHPDLSTFETLPDSSSAGSPSGSSPIFRQQLEYDPSNYSENCNSDASDVDDDDQEGDSDDDDVCDTRLVASTSNPLSQTGELSSDAGKVKQSSVGDLVAVIAMQQEQLQKLQAQLQDFLSSQEINEKTPATLPSQLKSSKVEIHAVPDSLASPASEILKRQEEQQKQLDVMQAQLKLFLDHAASPKIDVPSTKSDIKSTHSVSTATGQSLLSMDGQGAVHRKSCESKEFRRGSASGQVPPGAKPKRSCRCCLHCRSRAHANRGLTEPSAKSTASRSSSLRSPALSDLSKDDIDLSASSVTASPSHTTASSLQAVDIPVFDDSDAGHQSPSKSAASDAPCFNWERSPQLGESASVLAVKRCDGEDRDEIVQDPHGECNVLETNQGQFYEQMLEQVQKLIASQTPSPSSSVVGGGAVQHPPLDASSATSTGSTGRTARNSADNGPTMQTRREEQNRHNVREATAHRLQEILKLPSRNKELEGRRADSSDMLLPYPKINYVSFSLDDAVDESTVRFNALAAKYVPRELLLTQQAVEYKSKTVKFESTMDGDVMCNVRNTMSVNFSCNMSMASRKYLQRYDLLPTDKVVMDDIDEDRQIAGMGGRTAADASVEAEPRTGNVLDMQKLRNLPKLL